MAYSLLFFISINIIIIIYLGVSCSSVVFFLSLFFFLFFFFLFFCAVLNFVVLLTICVVLVSVSLGFCIIHLLFILIVVSPPSSLFSFSCLVAFPSIFSFVSLSLSLSLSLSCSLISTPKRRIKWVHFSFFGLIAPIVFSSLCLLVCSTFYFLDLTSRAPL